MFKLIRNWGKFQQKKIIFVHCLKNIKHTPSVGEAVEK